MFCVILGMNVSYAQELNCQVSVLVDAKVEVSSTEKEIIKQMEQSIFDLMNNTQWTKDKFKTEERIKCNMQIQIREIPSTGTYKGYIQVQSSRPSFNSSYNTILLNFEDENFDESEFDESEFDEDEDDDDSPSTTTTKIDKTGAASAGSKSAGTTSQGTSTGSSTTTTTDAGVGAASAGFIAVNPAAKNSPVTSKAGTLVNPQQNTPIDISNVEFTRKTPADVFIQAAQVGLYAMGAGAIVLSLLAVSRAIRRK